MSNPVVLSPTTFLPLLQNHQYEQVPVCPIQRPLDPLP